MKFATSQLEYARLQSINESFIREYLLDYMFCYNSTLTSCVYAYCVDDSDLHDCSKSA